MGKWQLGIIGAFLLVYSLTVLLTGHPEYLIVTALLAALVLAYAGANVLLARRMTKQYGDMDKAEAAEDASIPATHLITDDETAAGDTPEAHDEINPHDLPKNAPGRLAAEEQAAEQGGTTGGDADPSESGGGRFTREGNSDATESQPSMKPGGVTPPVR